MGRRFDTENSGFIRREDLFKVLESESEALQVMKELDVNQDGKISYEEFIGSLATQWCQQIRKNGWYVEPIANMQIYPFKDGSISL